MKVKAIFYGEGHVPQSTCLCGRGPKAGVLMAAGFAFTLCRPCIEEAVRKTEADAVYAREVESQLGMAVTA